MKNSAMSSIFRNGIVAGAFLGLSAMLAVSALAMGGGDDSPKAPSSPKPSKTCPSGYKYDKSKKQCVKEACASGQLWSSKAGSCTPGKSAAVTDDELRYEGIWLAKNDRYAEALDMLRLVKQQDDPRVLTYIGYSTRKLGRVEEGIGYYMKALAINPDYHTVREYLGEGYLQEEKPDLAREQLSELEKRCGKDCIEYRTLAAAIDGKAAPAEWH